MASGIIKLHYALFQNHDELFQDENYLITNFIINCCLRSQRISRMQSSYLRDQTFSFGHVLIFAPAAEAERSSE